jgi:threonine aldolase
LGHEFHEFHEWGTQSLTGIIDLRSDASTLPTLEIRRAMAEAEVGNDDFGEDPTIGRLEEILAGLLGKEAALFLQSGTMGNLVAVLSQVDPGDQVLISPSFHIFDHERDAMLRVAGCSFELFEDKTYGGETRLRVPDHAHAPLLCLENTVNRLGGTLLHPGHVEELCAWARRRGMRVHLDGARLFNAACALGVSEAELARPVDTVMVVFTKALAAPAGAALAGSRSTIAHARRVRWMLGGNWKQGGMVAAACLTALETMRDRIPDDHARARRLAEGLNTIPGVRVDLARVVTNIVLMRIEEDLVDVDRFAAAVESGGARIGRFKPDMCSRLVTHKDIDDGSVNRFLGLVADAVSCTRRAGA